MKQNAAVNKFNSGIVSRLGLARTDVKHIQFAAETQTNWMPRVLGSMMLRPGTQYIDSTLGNAAARHIPFIFTQTDTAILEMTPNTMRVRVNEQIISRVSVGTAITNGTFATNLANWTQNDEAGATSSWASAGNMSLIGTSFNSAIRYQLVTVAAADTGKEHGLHIVINRGYVKLAVGVSAGDGTYVFPVVLTEGSYSFAFMPTGNFYVQLSATTQYGSLVGSVAIEAAGAMTLPTPYAAADLQNLRWDESADEVFVACKGIQQYKVLRYATRSWAFVKYLVDDGPFLAQNTDQSLQITPSAITGDITLSANNPIFQPGHVGAIFNLTSVGQLVVANFSGENQFSDPVEVTGVGSGRTLGINISGTWVGTVTLQYSVGAPGAWIDKTSYTTNQSNITFNDGLDNSILFFRLGIKTGNYTSGTANTVLSFAGGSINGRLRITAVTNSKAANAVVLKSLGGVSATSLWSQGIWSTLNGFPTAVQFFQGRLWWSGQNSLDGSVSDAFGSYDPTVVGDSGPIDTSIGSGPVDTINWILGGLLLLVGGQGAEHSLSSGLVGTPITPTSFVMRSPSSFGSSNVQMQKVDWNCVFVKKDGVRVCVAMIENAYFSYDYKTSDLTLFCPEIGLPGVIQLAVQRIPDTRIHAVRSDGKVAVNIWDDSEEVKAWVLVDLGSNAFVEDAFVLPPLPIGTIDPTGVYNDANGNTTLVPEDTVYYVVRRVINGSTVRYLERWSLEYECQGGTLSKQVDCHAVMNLGNPSTAMTVPQLAGQSVVIWGDGKALGTVTADGSGNITLPTAASNVVAGLGYTAQYKSSKLAYGAQQGTALNQKKIVTGLGLLMVNTHISGVTYSGKGFDKLRNLPTIVKGAIQGADTILAEYDMDMTSTSADWDTDSRVYLQAQSPYPVTLLGLTVGVTTDE